MNIICVIGARGGSKGVAGKNIRPLLGKLLLVGFEQAQSCSLVNRVEAPTDSLEIANVARNLMLMYLS